MNESSYEKICSHASYLKLDLGAQELAQFVFDHQYNDSQIEAIDTLLEHLAENKRENIVATLLKMSRLPLKEPKTFENFDYSRLHGRQIDALKETVGTNTSGIAANKEAIASNTAKLVTTSKNITLAASSWSSGTYTISDSLITATSNQEIIPATNISADQYKALVKASLVATGQTTGSITIKAFGKTPSINIPVTIIFRGEK